MASRPGTPTERVGALLTVLGLAAFFASTAALMPSIDAYWTKAALSLRAPRPFHSDLVLVGFEETSPPLTRPTLAAVLDSLVISRPSVVALDVSLAPDGDSTGTAALRAALERAEVSGVAVVAPVELALRRRSEAGRAYAVWGLPDSALVPHLHLGFVTYEGRGLSRTPLSPAETAPLVLDVPWVVERDDGRFLPSFPLIAVAAHDGVWRARNRPRPPTWGAEEVAGLVHAVGAVGGGDATVGATVEAARRPALIGAAAEAPYEADLAFRTAGEVLAGLGLSRGLLRGRVVLVADLVPRSDGVDMVSTPRQTARGGILQLFALDTLLSGASPRRVGPLWAVLFTVALCLGVLRAWAHSDRRGAAATALALVALGVTAVAVVQSGRILPVVPMAWWVLLAAVSGLSAADALRASTPWRPHVSRPLARARASARDLWRRARDPDAPPS